MEHVKKKVLRSAIKKLAALGAKYAIQLPDGELIDGGLKGAQLGKLKPAGGKRLDWSEFNMKEKLNAMDVGDVVEFSTKGTSFAPSALMCNLSSRGIHKFGKGNFVTSMKGTRVQALRVK